MDVEYGTVEESVDQDNQIRLGTGSINKTRLSQLSIAFVIGAIAGMAMLSSPVIESSLGVSPSSSSRVTYQNLNITSYATAPCSITPKQLHCLKERDLAVCSQIPDGEKQKKKRDIKARILRFLFFNVALLFIGGFAEPRIKWHMMHKFHIAAMGCLGLLLVYVEISILFF